jgi:hypothetical protein
MECLINPDAEKEKKLISEILSSVYLKNFEDIGRIEGNLVNEKFIQKIIEKEEKSQQKLKENSVLNILKNSENVHSTRDTFLIHKESLENSISYDQEMINEEKQMVENEHMVNEYNDLKPDLNIIELLELHKHTNVQSLRRLKDFSVIPLVQAQIGLDADNFKGLEIMRRAEDLHTRNIKEIFEIYLMRRHPRIKEVLERVGMHPDELELRMLPTDQLMFIEDLLLKTKDSNLPHLIDNARIFYDLIKGN